MSVDEASWHLMAQFQKSLTRHNGEVGVLELVADLVLNEADVHAAVGLAGLRDDQLVDELVAAGVVRVRKDLIFALLRDDVELVVADVDDVLGLKHESNVCYLVGHY